MVEGRASGILTHSPTFDLGNVRVTRVSGGINLLDGGGMNGILPKPVWERWYPPDEKNRIVLETNCLVVETEDSVILIESGCGNKLSEKEKEFYVVEEGDWIGAHLLASGFSLDSFTQVILTHLHTDHCGGVVTRDESGALVPTFSNARVAVPQPEHADAQAGYGISPMAYNPANYEPLRETDQLELLPPDAEITSRIHYVATPGHTRGHQSVLVRGDRLTLLFTGDLIPLARHFVPHYNMAYEVDTVVKAKTKQAVLEKAHEAGWILLLSHEPYAPFCRVVRNEKRNRLEFAPWEGD